MGQYFKPVSVNLMEGIYPFDMEQFSKLMEHSYVGNPLLNAVEHLLLKEWSGHEIVWAGDYASADDEDFPGIHEGNLYEQCKEIKLDNEYYGSPSPVRYFLNLDSEQYFDKQDAILGQYNLTIHPLPLLTASSNGQGGGDYCGKAGSEFVGDWSGQRIVVLTDSVEDQERLATQYADFEKIAPGFIEAF